MAQFTFYWRDGQRDVFEGRNPADALNQAGYGAGALAALDFYARGDCKNYEWDSKAREWENITLRRTLNCSR